MALISFGKNGESEFVDYVLTICSIIVMLFFTWNVQERKLITFSFQLDVALFFLVPIIEVEYIFASGNIFYYAVFQIFIFVLATFILYKKSKDWVNSVFQYVTYYLVFIWIYAFFSSMILILIIYNVLNNSVIIDFLDKDPVNNWYYCLTGFAILVYAINGIFIKCKEFEIAKVALTIVAAIFGVLAAFSDIIKPFKLPFLSDQIIDSEVITRLTIPYLSGTLVALAIINFREFQNKQTQNSNNG